MKLFSRILPLLAIALPVFVASAQAAPTLTIVDQNTPHADILRYEPFFATLQATPHDAPQSHDEIRVTGPTFSWSGGGDGLSVVPSNTSQADLKSATTPNYGDVESLKLNGDKTATVTCTAIYGVTSSTQGTLPSISVPGSITVNFFVRVPKLVESYGKRPAVTEIDVSPIFPGDTHKVQFFSPYRPTTQEYRGQLFGIIDWGAGDTYSMKLSDNKGGHYGQGMVYESFPVVTPEGERPNGDRGPSHWSPPLWEDTVQKASPTQPNNLTAVWLEFDQLWYVEEYGQRVDLNTHRLKLTPSDTTRSY